MKTRLILAIALAVAAGMSSSRAEAQIRTNTVEISPFYGRLFGGEFARASTTDVNGQILFHDRIDVADADTWGVRLGYNFTELAEFEIQGSRTDTHLITHESGDIFGPGGERLGDLRIDYLIGYATFNFGHRRLVPYATIGLGAARLQPSATPLPSHDSTRFTASLGGGLKFFVNPHFGLRVDGRGYATELGRDDNCSGHHDNCDRHHYLDNGELTGGLVLAF